MFVVVARDKVSGKLGVLDTTDFAVEFHDWSTVKMCISKGIDISGVIHEDHTWNIHVESPVFPEKLKALIKSASSGYPKLERVYFEKTATSYFGMLQKNGVNLLNWACTHTEDDVYSAIGFD